MCIRDRLLSNAIVIPNSAIYQSSYVYIVEEGVLKRKDISILWHNETDAIISHGLNINDQLVITALGQISSGTPVAVNGKPSQPKRPEQGDRQKHLQKMAEEQGISVAELMEKRQKQRRENGGQL